LSVTLPILRWREDDRRKIITAIIVSVLLHLLLIGGVGLVFSLRPEPQETKPEEPPPELTFIPPPPQLQTLHRQNIDTSASQPSEKPPQNAPFESDRDTSAASSAPPTGALPLPSQEGETSPGVELAEKEYTPGKMAQPTPASAPLVARPMERPKEAPTPEPVSTPQPTPRQTAQLALLEPPKQQTATPKPTPVEAQNSTPEIAPQRSTNPAPSSFQPQTRITRIHGNISTRGRASVEALGTPLGRYKKMMSDAIGSRWYYYVNNQMGLLNIGSVTISFIVEKSGKVSNIKVESNTSNDSFAACSAQAIMDAEIPPIPSQLIPMLEGGRIQIDYTFTILGN